MSLRKTIVTAIVVTLVSLIAMLYVVTRNNILDSFSRIERGELDKDVRRVHEAVFDRFEALETLARDWSAWDDTYEFVATGSGDYIESNLVDQTFIDTGLDVIAFYDTDGRLVFGKAFDRELEATTAFPEEISALISGPGNLAQLDADASLTGIFNMRDRTLVISAHPILTSEGQGPVRGTLIMARALDTALIERIAQATALELAVQRLEAVPADGTMAAAMRRLEDAPGDVVITPISDGTIAGYSYLHDVFADPSHLIAVTAPRTIYGAGRNSVRTFLVSLVIVGAVLMLLVLLLLDRLVLMPVSRLHREVAQFSETGVFSGPEEIRGSEELAQLARSIRRLFADVESARGELQQHNERLEVSVRERTDELAQARDAAIEALKTKDRILANVGHDSRTPLNTIMLRTELMKNGRYGPVTGEQQHALDSIITSVNQLTLSTTNMLFEAQSGHGGISVKGETFPLDGELTRVLDAMRPLAEKKGLRLSLHLAEGTSGDVHINRQAFHLVLSNLVDNAIKFTDHGRIDIRVERPDPEQLSLTVADTGRGIPESVRRFIFDPFWQLDASVTRDTNRGVGLGLSIVKVLVEHLNGSIQVHSSGAGGTEFVVTLPVAVRQAAVASA